jgi:predicted ArsR family transcriptional regulator
MATKSVWVSTSQAAAELGVSTKFLLNQRERLFKKGIHWRCINPEAWRPTYRWHLKRLQQLMEA